MKKILWILPLALFALSCGGDDVKMPWEDDLGKGEQQKPQPEPAIEQKSLSIKEMQETISRLEAKFNAQYKGMELDNAPIIKRLKRSRTNPFMYPIEKTDWEA